MVDRYTDSRDFLELCLAKHLAESSEEDSTAILRKFRTRRGPDATKTLKNTVERLRKEGETGFLRLKAEQERAFEARLQAA